MDHHDNGSWLPLNFMQRAWKRNACVAFLAGRNAFFYHQLLRYHLSMGDKDAARSLLHHALWHFRNRQPCTCGMRTWLYCVERMWLGRWKVRSIIPNWKGSTKRFYTV